MIDFLRNSRKLRSFICIFISALLLAVTGCSKKDKASTDSDTLKIGIQNLEGNFNPFFSESEGDKSVISQIIPQVQLKNANNKLVNNAGSITYEYEDNAKVKYTVTINDDLYFSDGTNATIDDVLFWYYVLADATYDGVYSDFYLNDIDGLKEYYYDDENYEAALSEFNGNKQLISAYISDNYADGADVTEIRGIKRIDNYTCTVLFNSRNINSISQINAYILSKAFYGPDYVKGSAEKIKDITSSAMGCGEYYLSELKDDEAVLLLNKYYTGETSSFKTVEFIDLSAKNKDSVDAVTDGYVDIVTASVTPSAISKLNKDNIKYTVQNSKYYYSLFFNTNNGYSQDARRILMAVCNVYDVVDESLGSYYTKLYFPMSVRFEETPQLTEAYYNQTSKASQLKGFFSSLNAYCTGTEDDIEYKIFQKYAEILKSYGVTLNIHLTDENGLKSAISSNSADMWIDITYDGETCDKYDYYHTGGSKNLAGISSTEIDDLTERIRKATGFTDRASLVKELMSDVMSYAAELPLYQPQTVTIYNTDTISEDKLNEISYYDGYSGIIATF